MAPRSFQPAAPQTSAPAVHPDARRGRGAITNESGRFEAQVRVTQDDDFTFDDGWGGAEAAEPTRTTVEIDISRTIIARNQSPDVGFDRSINPYRGCEHGCLYCFARPTHAYLGLSPGLDFETRLFAKPDAPALLANALSKPSYKCRMIAMGTNTDPYQPIEERYAITRDILKVLSAFGHPVGIVTKAARVTRDVNLLADMAARGLAHVMLSVTTLDHRLARKMEPRASTPQRRLDAIRLLSSASIPTGVMVAPIIPGLTDHEIEPILEAAAAAGARTASYVMLRLPHEIKDLARDWLQENVPDRAAKVISHVRDTRGGKDYD
ncbi:MAG: PA0069 family radical SAM protein, partial [Alphaproteobacteria bacterium]|nr:PA0069 family radical SAM protein [Alphaproteobacteria bacterium]